MTHKKTGVAKKLKSLPDLLGAINAYYDCSTGLDISGAIQVLEELLAQSQKPEENEAQNLDQDAASLLTN